MKKTKLLLIEDDKTMSMLLKTLLDFEGFETTTCSEGNMEEIISIIRDQKPRIIIMDVFMNDLNGIELLTSIKSRKDILSPVFLMTSGMDMRKECLDAGADGFMIKPYLPDELIDWLHSHSIAEND